MEWNEWMKTELKATKQSRGFLRRNEQMFATHDKPLGATDLLQHRINTWNAQRIRQASRRLLIAEKSKKIMNDMKEQGIKEYNSPWSSKVMSQKGWITSIPS